MIVPNRDESINNWHPTWTDDTPTPQGWYCSCGQRECFCSRPLYRDIGLTQMIAGTDRRRGYSVVSNKPEGGIGVPGGGIVVRRWQGNSERFVRAYCLHFYPNEKITRIRRMPARELFLPEQVRVTNYGELPMPLVVRSRCY